MDKSTIANILIALAVIAAGGMVINGKSGSDTTPFAVNENTTYKVVYDGGTPIKDAFTSSASMQGKTELDSYDKATALASITDGVMVKEKYPYEIINDKTIIKVDKYRCNPDICWYWISATRDGEKVATNSPIGISPPPYEAFISETYDDKVNEMTTTLREDPKLAVEQVLQQYVDRQPVGKAVVGTKE